MKRRASMTGRASVQGVAVLALLVCGGTPQAAIALEATPIASPTAVTCLVTPRSTAEILTLTETTSSEAAPVRELPTGVHASPETTAAVTMVLEEMAACLTAGDMLRFYALHSDAWLRRSLSKVDGMAILTTSIPPLDDGHRAVPGPVARADPARRPGAGGDPAGRR